MSCGGKVNAVPSRNPQSSYSDLKVKPPLLAEINTICTGKGPNPIAPSAASYCGYSKQASSKAHSNQALMLCIKA